MTVAFLTLLNMIIDVFIMVFSVQKLDNKKKFFIVLLLYGLVCMFFPHEYRFSAPVIVAFAYARNLQELLNISLISLIIIMVEVLTVTLFNFVDALIVTFVIKLFYLAFIDFMYKIEFKNKSITNTKLIIIINLILIILFYTNYNVI